MREYLEELHVHHKTYVRRGLEWRNLDDLIVLCHACHEEAHKPVLPAAGEVRKPPARAKYSQRIYRYESG